MPLRITSHSLKASEDFPYHITAKSHATGMHKECWEPILEHLFDVNPPLHIKEAWSIDCINHGEAAVLNEEILLTRFTEQFTWDNYGRALARFLTAGPDRGACVDFSKETLVAVGHSMGAVATVWLQQEPSIPVRFASLVLVEPMLQPPGYDLSAGTKFFVTATYQRRDVWPSRDAASNDLKSSKGYKLWDRSMIDIFTQHALRPHPAANFTSQPFKGVVLACSRLHEAACYRGSGRLPEQMVTALGDISRQIAVHFVWGEISDSIPKEIKAALVNETHSGICVASVGWVPDAGHLVIQNSPTGSARAIARALAKSTYPPPVKSKL